MDSNKYQASNYIIVRVKNIERFIDLTHWTGWGIDRLSTVDKSVGGINSGPYRWKGGDR